MADSRRLVEPSHILFDTDDSFHHTIGGGHDLGGAICPNCHKPLLLYLSLNVRDPLLGLELGASRIPFLSCMRCPLSWYDFSYRVVSDEKIEILSVYCEDDAGECERVAAEWYANGFFDQFERRSITLAPMPARLQELHDKLNEWRKLTPEEVEELATLTDCYADADVGGYPRYDVINQIGGRSFIQQRVVDPDCPHCSEVERPVQMYFIASLVNDESADFRIAPDGFQMLFFLCARCSSVTAFHVCS